ncbi:MAG: hypothetical protein Q8O37_16510 [Sulfuricellaceae bacterium]|nr:hypothetical protein [Sulfuricellaceae bacterium]
MLTKIAALPVLFCLSLLSATSLADVNDNQRMQCRDMSNQYAKELVGAKSMGVNIVLDYDQNASDVERKVRNHMIWLADKGYAQKELQTSGFSHCLAQY